MPGLVPGFHVLFSVGKDVDGRAKPGHDEIATAVSAAPSRVDRRIGRAAPSLPPHEPQLTHK
jgi:hypothetical protein